MSDYADFTRNRIYNLDALTFLKTLPSESINCVVTSPPYWSLRDYGVEGQIGLEPTLKEFIETMAVLFREVRRVLRNDGTCWVNMGDSYASAWGSGRRSVIGNPSRTNRFDSCSTTGLKEKDLCGQPWRLAFALQDDGWYLRSDIIWHKPNPMPESVSDRPTKSHEYVFLLTKSERYFYDADAIREPSINSGKVVTLGEKSLSKGQAVGMNRIASGNGNADSVTVNPERNKRSVWTIPTEPTPFAHFATFPQALIEPMILAGCPDKICSVCGAPYVREVERETSYDHVTTADGKSKIGPYSAQTGNGAGSHDIRHGVYSHTTTLGFKPTCACNAPTRPGIVLDIFMGSGTVALVSRRLGRDFLGSELNPEYVALANSRLAHNSKAELKAALAGELATMPMF